jgi:putative Mn2+ efflux pump MntP
MDAATILAIAISLAMDAFSASIAYGACAKDATNTLPWKWRHPSGTFQMLMPLSRFWTSIFNRMQNDL